MRNMSAFTGIALQISAEKRENHRLALEAQAKAEKDPLACRVRVKAGEHAGQTGLLQTWAGTDGLVAVLLSDGRVVKVTAADVEKREAVHAGIEKLDAEHLLVAEEHGFVAAVRTPTSEEEAKDVIAKFIRGTDMGRRALGEQMLRNRAALAAAQVKDADFSRLGVYAAVKLNILGTNQTEVAVGDHVVFFSYDRPVAAQLGDRVVVTAATLTPTGARHLKAWLGTRKAETVEQAELDTLAAGLEAAAKKATSSSSTSSSSASSSSEPTKVKAGQVADFKIEDIGLENPQNYVGRGIMPENKWDAVFTGVGNSYSEAVHDAMELAEASGYDTEGLAVPELEDPRTSQDMVGEDSELLYHVALYVNGERRLEGSRRILVNAAPLSKEAQELYDRIQKRKAAAAEKAKAAPAPEAPAARPTLTPPADLKKRAEEAVTPKAPVKPSVPEYPGIQKPGTGKAPAGEEAHRIKHENPGTVKEGEPTTLKVTQDKPATVDEKRLDKLKAAPPEVREFIINQIAATELVAEIETAAAMAAKNVKDSEGYDAVKGELPKLTKALSESLKQLSAEAGLVEDAVAMVERMGLKPDLSPEMLKELRDLDEKHKEEMKALREKLQEKARASNLFSEEQKLTLFVDPRKRSGESADTQPGADTLSKAGISPEDIKKAKEGLRDEARTKAAEKTAVKSALDISAGLLDFFKGALEAIKKAASGLSSTMKKSVKLLEKITADKGESDSASSASSESTSSESASSSSGALQASRRRREERVSIRV